MCAAEREPTNPWYRSRLVTFLIGQGRLRAGREAWLEAVADIDPDGTRVARDPWLAHHFHRWVAASWLGAGAVADAFEVLKGVPDEIIDASQQLSELRHDVLDAMEADALGGAVYPASVRITDRWTKPRALPSSHDGHALVRGYPGRVIDGDKKRVHVFYGTRSPAGRYEALLTEIEGDAWRRMGMSAARPDTFVELGVYDDGHRSVVAAVDGEAHPPAAATLPLAYFDRWRSRK